MAPLSLTVLAIAGALLSVTMAASAQSTTYVAPDPTVGLSSANEVYLIGVVSTALVVLATYMAVKSMTDINYDDDTLLMVEVPEDDHHAEE